MTGKNANVLVRGMFSHNSSLKTACAKSEEFRSKTFSYFLYPIPWQRSAREYRCGKVVESFRPEFFRFGTRVNCGFPKAEPRQPKGGWMIREEWKRIWEFPQYSVSNYGRVRDEHKDRLMATSGNGFCEYNQGHLKISLLDRNTGARYTRSVALLVARAFVEVPDHLSDAVIRLDGKEENVVAWNLAWRPRWFAWHYAHQLRTQQPLAFQNLKVQNVTHGYVYRSVVDAAMTEGLLFDDVWRSCCHPKGVRIYPHQSVYTVIDRV